MTRQIAAAVLLVTGLAVFVGLGVWQLQRLAWKQGVLAEITAQIEAAPVALPARPDRTRDEYLPVAVSGTIEMDTLDVLVSSKDWGPGFRLISPLVTDDGRRVLLDRGFVASDEREAPRSYGAVRVEGNLHWPDERDGFTPEDDPEGNWWYARDVDKMAAALGTEPLLVVARTPTDPIIRPMPVTTEAIRNKHFEYAMTWFLFAATWVGMTGYALWRIRRRNS